MCRTYLLVSLREWADEGFLEWKPLPERNPLLERQEPLARRPPLDLYPPF